MDVVDCRVLWGVCIDDVASATRREFIEGWCLRSGRSGLLLVALGLICDLFDPRIHQIATFGLDLDLKDSMITEKMLVWLVMVFGLLIASCPCSLSPISRYCPQKDFSQITELLVWNLWNQIVGTANDIQLSPSWLLMSDFNFPSMKIDYQVTLVEGYSWHLRLLSTYDQPGWITSSCTRL